MIAAVNVLTEPKPVPDQTLQYFDGCVYEWHSSDKVETQVRYTLLKPCTLLTAAVYFEVHRGSSTPSV